MQRMTHKAPVTPLTASLLLPTYIIAETLPRAGVLRDLLRDEGETADQELHGTTNAWYLAATFNTVRLPYS